MDKSLFKKYCPNIRTILEAGCHNGSDTIDFSNKFPSSKIYGFEPVPYLFNRLSEKVKDIDNIKIFNIGLYNYNGIGDFYVCSGRADASSSALPPKEHLVKHPDILFENKDIIKVQYLTIDEWARQNNIEYIDLMWLDMQGAERQTLEASPNILSKVQVIHSEVSMVETYSGVCLYKDYKLWMESKGFYVAHEDMKYNDMNDVLFVRK